MGDVNKARLLLKSVRDTNPKHGPGCIAAAHVEEATEKTAHARKLIMEGCKICPDNEDVLLQAARLHPEDQANTVLAAANENHDYAKKAVLRKALKANQNYVTLWKAAIDLEDAGRCLEMWLALACLRPMIMPAKY